MNKVTRDEAIKFLESACRNWEYVSFTLEDADDVADALTRFVAARSALECEPNESGLKQPVRSFDDTFSGYDLLKRTFQPDHEPDEAMVERVAKAVEPELDKQELILSDPMTIRRLKAERIARAAIAAMKGRS